MDRLTRRQALRAGAGALALSAVRLPSPARAASRPALFELAVPATAGAGWRTTAVLRAPRRFDLVGLRWAAGPGVQAQVRARVRGGRWTPWTPLGAAHGPVGGTEPAFTGTADELQLRLRGSARGLRARLVRALGTAPPRARAATIDPPAIIPRPGWGGDRVPPRAAPEYGTVQAAFVHHTATASAYGPEDSASIVLGIARYHRDSNGWNDIGYNFLVDRYGQVFEGRAGGIDAAVVGAQAQGYNAQSTGIACIGTFSAAAQTEAGLDALARLIGWKLSLHGVPVQGEVTLVSSGGASNRYRAGTAVVVQRVCGHRDGDQTTCPGDALYGQLPDVRRRASRYAGPLSAITVRAASHQRGATPVGLSGVLRFADGSSPGGATLSIEYRGGGSAWAPVAATVCGDDGAWATSALLPASGRVRAVFAGDATRPRIESRPIRVAVVPSLTLTTDRRRRRAGRAFAVSGTMAPAQRRVVCRLEVRAGGRWVTVQRKRIAVRGGRYATSVRPRRPGLYRVSIQAAGVTRRRTLRALR